MSRVSQVEGVYCAAWGSRGALGVSPGVKGVSRGSQVVKGYVRCPNALRWASRGSQGVRVLSV